MPSQPQNEFVIGATGRETPEILVPSTARNRLRREGETPLNNDYRDQVKRRRDDYGDELH